MLASLGDSAVARHAVTFLQSAVLAAALAAPSRGSAQGDVSPAQPVIPDRTFNLNDFGAVADARTLNTDAFRFAIAAVENAGGGILIVPAGIYLTGPISLCSRMNLHLDSGATILFSPHETPSGDGRMPPLLLARNAHDVAVSGAGTINGSGEAWWPGVHEFMKRRGPRPARPYLVSFDCCQRVRIEGVTLTHSPEFTLVPTHCQDVTIYGITIYNPADDATEDDGVPPEQVLKNLHKAWDDESPNTDGIDPMVSQRVLIENCLIDTGDDCIAIKANEGGVTQDILITDCTFLHGHGCTVGSGEKGGLRNMTVRRCAFLGTLVGINLESARDRGSLIENISFSDITMKDVGDAIILTSYYPNGAEVERPFSGKFVIDLFNSGHDQAQPVTTTTPHWLNITIRNVTATCIWEAGLILGLPEMPAERIVLDHVDIRAPLGFHINYAKDVTLHDVHITARHGPPLMMSDTVEGLKQ